MTSLFWRPPSANIIERMQQRVSESNSEQRGLKGTLNEDIKSLWSERDRGTWEVWATDERGVAVEDDADILKANASMLNGWESRAASCAFKGCLLIASGIHEAGARLGCRDSTDDHTSAQSLLCLASVISCRRGPS